MTLIVLLILAAVSLSAVFSEKGIFSRAEKAGNKYNEAKAREVLETVLLADGQYEKNTNSKYNQDDFLDDLIKSQIEGSEIKGDVAIVGEYAFELDRSVPKIGRYLGLAKDLVFPTVEITSGPTLISNGRESTFTAKATEESKGITKIELWLNGKKIDKYTQNYETPQTEITKEFTVNKNGNYTIKAYADLMGSTRTTVEGIVPAVKFTPNGSEEWKKEHTTQIIVEETAETITEMKYIWVKDNGENEPADNLFTADCLNNRTVTGGNETMTGQYYLWVMIKTGTGENVRINKYSSNAFNFDNEGPTVVLTPTPVSETSFTLIATAKDNKNGISKYVFYVDEVEVDTQTTTAETATYTWTGTGMVENKECYVIVYDGLGNSNVGNTSARTKLYSWDVLELTKPAVREVQEYEGSSYHALPIMDTTHYFSKNKPSYNSATGEWGPWTETCEYVKYIGLEKPELLKKYENGYVWCYGYYNVYQGELRKIVYSSFNKDYMGDKKWWSAIEVSPEEWSVKNAEYSSNKTKYVDGEIVDGKKYIYKGLR